MNSTNFQYSEAPVPAPMVGQPVPTAMPTIPMSMPTMQMSMPMGMPMGMQFPVQPLQRNRPAHLHNVPLSAPLLRIRLHGKHSRETDRVSSGYKQVTVTTSTLSWNGNQYLDLPASGTVYDLRMALEMSLTGSSKFYFSKNCGDECSSFLFCGSGVCDSTAYYVYKGRNTAPANCCFSGFSCWDNNGQLEDNMRLSDIFLGTKLGNVKDSEAESAVFGRKKWDADAEEAGAGASATGSSSVSASGEQTPLKLAGRPEMAVGPDGLVGTFDVTISAYSGKSWRFFMPVLIILVIPMLIAILVAIIPVHGGGGGYDKHIFVESDSFMRQNADESVSRHYEQSVPRRHGLCFGGLLCGL